MKFFAFIFFTYGLFCIILALLQLRYFYKNKPDKKFIDFKQYTKSMVSLLLTVSILLSLIMFFKSLPITIANSSFSLILVFYIFTLNKLNKKYGIPKNKKLKK
ncbi:hypothetical protein [Paraclostridium sordellii]|uniref:hypothetical protein n=1 Tax=Paraclostridium sordellii TaxID=1505 RepID=UPI000C7776CD|nr:hypothetical protein [Paeniclostridium sordellii]AUN14275.1 hypothetical protein RSJ16_08585 [Paeniclostridium sordellii]